MLIHILLYRVDGEVAKSHAVSTDDLEILKHLFLSLVLGLKPCPHDICFRLRNLKLQ